MTREPLRVPKVLADAAKVRHPVQGDAYGTAPALVDNDILKFWIDVQHVWSDESFDIPWEAAGVIFATTKNQPAVLRKFPVVDDEKRVGHR